MVYMFLSVVLFLVSLVLILVVAVQASKGEGLGSLGGGVTLFAVKNKGFEATMDKITAILAGSFLLIALVLTALEKNIT